MPIIELKPNKPTKEQQLSDFFAVQETKDFMDMFGVFREQCQMSYLFQDLDFKSIYESIITNVKKQHFDEDGKLNMRSEKGIYGFYDMRLDMDEIYNEYIKNKK